MSIDNETPSTTQPEHPVAVATRQDPMSFGFTVGVSALVAITVAVCSIVAYHNLFRSAPKRVATVDLNEIVNIKQLQITQAATKVGATDVEREAAWNAIGDFGSRVEAEIGNLQKDCNCVLVVRAAVIKGAADDYTDLLKKRLGMDGVTVASAIDALSGTKEISK